MGRRQPPISHRRPLFLYFQQHSTKPLCCSPAPSFLFCNNILPFSCVSSPRQTSSRRYFGAILCITPREQALACAHDPAGPSGSNGEPKGDAGRKTTKPQHVKAVTSILGSGTVSAILSCAARSIPEHTRKRILPPLANGSIARTFWRVPCPCSARFLSVSSSKR